MKKFYRFIRMRLDTVYLVGLGLAIGCMVLGIVFSAIVSVVNFVAVIYGIIVHFNLHVYSTVPVGALWFYILGSIFMAIAAWLFSYLSDGQPGNGEGVAMFCFLFIPAINPLVAVVLVAFCAVGLAALLSYGLYMLWYLGSQKFPRRRGYALPKLSVDDEH